MPRQSNGAAAEVTAGCGRRGVTKSMGRTGARDRARLPAPPTATELAAARKEVATAQRWLLELAAAHPSAKIWKARLRAAQAIVARAPADG